MRRFALLIAIAVLALPVAAHAQAPPLRAKLSSCASGPAASDRAAVFIGSMPAVKGTKRMSMRFDLQQRTPPATSFKAIKVPGLGVWQKSVPGRSTSGFVFKQRVQGLAAPGDYKAVVRFRWYGNGGALLRSTSRTSPICTEPDPRPDLRAGELGAILGPGSGQATYYLDVFNDGRADAGPFDVGLTIAGADQPDVRVAAGIATGSDTTLTFVAPRCAPGTMLRFTLDTRGEVQESAESDDVVQRVCPFVS
jgi:hypothetical protein